MVFFPIIQWLSRTNITYNDMKRTIALLAAMVRFMLLYVILVRDSHWIIGKKIIEYPLLDVLLDEVWRVQCPCKRLACFRMESSHLIVLGPERPAGPQTRALTARTFSGVSSQRDGMFW